MLTRGQGHIRGLWTTAAAPLDAGCAARHGRTGNRMRVEFSRVDRLRTGRAPDRRHGWREGLQATIRRAVSEAIEVAADARPRFRTLVEDHGRTEGRVTGEFLTVGTWYPPSGRCVGRSSCAIVHLDRRWLAARFCS
jgi:hypothetical protein